MSSRQRPLLRRLAACLVLIASFSVVSAPAFPSAQPPPDGQPPPEPGPGGPGPIVVRIDVWPDAPNLTPLGHGVIPVTLFGSDTFDVSQVNLATLRLEGAAPASASSADKDGDAYPDFQLRFRQSDMNLSRSTTMVTLTGTLRSGQAFSGTDEITIVDNAVELVGTLYVVNQARAPGACDGAPACKGPLANAEVRLFTRADASTDRRTLAARFSAGDHVSGCETWVDGSCFMGAPGPANYETILRWKDPGTSAVVYSLRDVSEDDFVGPVATVRDQVIKVIRNDGTVQYQGGKTQVVTG